ncbi:hypothetical protein [Salmonella phage SD-12_S18]|nr:hypothetical protein [Salmonella phage SD-12_S18]
MRNKTRTTDLSTKIRTLLQKPRRLTEILG